MQHPPDDFDWKALDAELATQTRKFHGHYQQPLNDREIAFQVLAMRFGLITFPQYAEPVVRAFVKQK
jgi:hypothetical protein